ncbi:MAG TPA: hypothetical protein VLX31_14075 [Streptosporangiaceae bacterium]|nr:hypothetical protein [Streptosporangiaceae bacterium]
MSAKVHPMPDELASMPMALPAAIDRRLTRPPTPAEALHVLLRSQPHAPRLLSEARHRAVLAGNSAAAADRAARVARDTEIGYEQVRRVHDPRGELRGSFWGSATAAGVLLLVAVAAALVLSWGLPWAGRLVFAAATVTLGAVVVWAHRRQPARRGLAAGMTIAVGMLCAGLVALRVLSGGPPAPLRLIEAVVLGVVLVMAIAGAVLVADRCECLTCCRARVRSERAGGARDQLTALAFSDQADAVAAGGAWESLVVEECRLMRPAGPDGEQWIAECIQIARQSATPAES